MLVVDLIQTESIKEKLYELTSNGIDYKFTAPWIDISVGMIGLSDIKGIDSYKDDKLSNSIVIKPLKNALLEVEALKSVVNIKSISNIGLLDNNNGVLYRYIPKLLDSREMYTGKYGEYCMRYIERGKLKIYIIHDTKSNMQIAEIRRPCHMVDNKIKYRIFLKDEYEYLLEIIALHLVFLDRARGRGQVVRGDSISYGYSYSKANKLYNESWILKNFDNSKIFDKVFFEDKIKLSLWGKLGLTGGLTVLFMWLIIGIWFLIKYGGII